MDLYSVKNAAKEAVNHYLCFNDEKLHHIPYFYAFFSPGGAVAHHCEWDFGDATGRYLDALVLCRKIIGENTPHETEHKYYNALKWMVSLGKDGLCHRPGGYDFVNPCVNTFDVRSALLGLLTFYDSVKGDEVLATAKNMIDGLISIGVDMGDYFYIPFAYYTPGTPVEHRHYDIKTNQADPCHYGGGVHILPLMMYHERTKDENILSLCGKIANFIINYSGVFEEDGGFFVTGYFAGEDGHFHSRMSTVLGILRYAIETGDRGMVEWCAKVYGFAKSQGTSYGFFPEGLGKKPTRNLPGEYPDVARHTEICCTADMIHIAALLSENGYDSYDDAERFANHLFKSQLLDISDGDYFKEVQKGDTASCSYHNVAERYRGAFLGRTMANDLLNNGRYDNMGCCAAAGGRGLWALWHYALTTGENNTAFLNLWLEVDNDVGTVKITEQTEWEDIFTLTVTLKKDCGLKIRIPEGIKVKKISQSKNTAEIIYEMESKTTAETLCGEPLEVTWRGNIVTDVSPKGIIPLYIRS